MSINEIKLEDVFDVVLQQDNKQYVLKKTLFI